MYFIYFNLFYLFIILESIFSNYYSVFFLLLAKVNYSLIPRMVYGHCSNINFTCTVRYVKIEYMVMLYV